MNWISTIHKHVWCTSILKSYQWPVKIKYSYREKKSLNSHISKWEKNSNKWIAIELYNFVSGSKCCNIKVMTKIKNIIWL